MKAIMLMFDSLNRHMLESYGCTWTSTPNLKRLAEHSVTFDRCYAGSLPCMPARRELHTGRYNFLHRSWGPIEPYDDSMPELLSKNGVYTHLISDHVHYWEDGGATYHQRYQTWEIIRGQEGDHWKPLVVPPPEPEHYGRYWPQDEINRGYVEKEGQVPIKNVYEAGLEFLRNNKDADNWFLQIESFDPHEPFYAPESFKAMYPDQYTGPRFDWPAYQQVQEPPEAVKHCRNLYAALLSECDYYVGKILDYMDEHHMWDDTMLIVNTDHGFLLGEHGWWAKGVMPLYEEISHIPLFIWDPRLKRKGERRNALVQTIDLAPTLLDYFHVEIPKDMQGKALTGVLEEDRPVREYALFGMFGRQINITDGRYVYIRRPNGLNSPLNEYTLMPTHMRSLFSAGELKNMELSEPFAFTKGTKVLRVPANQISNDNGVIADESYRNYLFDLASDPHQLCPMEDEKLEKMMEVKMIDLLKESDAPAEQYERMQLGTK